MKERFIELEGQRARLAEAGEGQPVLVLHGWGGRIESVRPILDCLRDNFRVVALDLPGFGDSPVPDGVWGTPDYSEYVADVLGAMSISSAHLVGHSFGAKTSFYLAATHPALVSKLVLVGSPGIRRPPSVRARAKRALSRTARAAGRLGPPGRKLRGAVYGRIASQDYREAGAMRPIFVNVVNEDLTHVLPRVKASTLLVWGTEDDAVPVEHARMMERLIPDAGLVLFEGAGHFAYLDDPSRFCRVIRHFFGAPVMT